MLHGKFVPIFNFPIDIKSHIEKFFPEERERFWKDGTFMSRERRRKVVDNKMLPIQFNKCTWNRNVNRKELSERLFEPFQSHQKYARIQAICLPEHTILKVSKKREYYKTAVVIQ